MSSASDTSMCRKYEKSYNIQHDIISLVKGYIRISIEPLLTFIIPNDVIDTIITQCSAKIYADYQYSHHSFTDISLPMSINSNNNNNNNFTQNVYKSGNNLYIETNQHNLFLYKSATDKFLKHPFFSNKSISFVSNSLYARHIFIATTHEKEKHAIYAFGDDFHGQLGIVNEENGINLAQWLQIHDKGTKVSKPTPIKLPKNTNYKIIDIAAGLYHSIFLTECGSVLSCGGNKYGQCGQMFFDNVNQITLVESLTNIMKISCGKFHTLCLDNNGKVFGFGNTNNMDKSCAIVDIKCGELFSCLLDKNGLVYMLSDGETYLLQKYITNKKLFFKKIDSGKKFSLLLANNNNNEIYKIYQRNIGKYNKLTTLYVDYDGKLDTDVISGMLVAADKVYLVVM